MQSLITSQEAQWLSSSTHGIILKEKRTEYKETAGMIICRQELEEHVAMVTDLLKDIRRIWAISIIFNV